MACKVNSEFMARTFFCFFFNERVEQKTSCITRISTTYQTAVSTVWVLGCDINTLPTIGLGQNYESLWIKQSLKLYSYQKSLWPPIEYMLGFQSKSLFLLYSSAVIPSEASWLLAKGHCLRKYHHPGTEPKRKVMYHHLVVGRCIGFIPRATTIPAVSNCLGYLNCKTCSHPKSYPSNLSCYLIPDTSSHSTPAFSYSAVESFETTVSRASVLWLKK